MSGNTEDDPLALVLAATEAEAAAAARAVAAPPTAEAAALAEIERRVAAMLRQITSDTRFLALEAAWRGLHRLCTRAAEAGAEVPIRIRLLPATKRELVRDFQGAREFEDSALYRAVCDTPLRDAEDVPFGALVVDFEWGAEAEDMGALAELAAIGAAALCPVVTAPGPGVFGVRSWAEFPAARDLPRTLDSPRLTRWRSLREAEESRFLVMALPRFRAGGEAAGWTGAPQALA